MESGKKVNKTYLHTAIGFAVCALFWILPPIDPITVVGMRCLGGFIAMVYLWTTVGTLWPSIFGLVIFGLSGISETGFKGVWLNAMGADTVLICLFALTFFSAADQAGVIKYIARWLLTRKVYEGRPIAFMAVFYVTCFLLSGLFSPVIGMILMWPVGMGIMEALGITKKEKVWHFFFVGMLLVCALGQPLLPFKGAPLVPISAFEKMTANAGNPMFFPMLPYIVTDIVMTTLVMCCFFIFVKIRKVDLSKIKNATPELIMQQMKLPAMNAKQKTYLIAIPIYLTAIMLPSYFPGNPVCDTLISLGVLGVTIIMCLALMILQYEGKPMLQWNAVTAKGLNWGIIFMIAGGVYGAGTLSNKATGITAWLLQVLNPLLGDRSEIVFIIILFTFAVIITNFAHNGAMAVLLMPVAIAFSEQMGIDPIPVAMGIVLLVFCAILTPAASVPSGMAYGRTEIYEAKEIFAIGFPMTIVTLVAYIFIGYPMIKFLVGA